MSDPNPHGRGAGAWRTASRLAVAAVLVGVFMTWLVDGPVSVGGLQGPNNGWLAAIMAVLAVPWLRMLERGSWLGVIGVAGAGLVIGWTALENWLDSRATFGASASAGLVLVLAAGIVLTSVAVVRGVELGRERFRHRETERAV